MRIENTAVPEDTTSANATRFLPYIRTVCSYASILFHFLVSSVAPSPSVLVWFLFGRFKWKIAQFTSNSQLNIYVHKTKLFLLGSAGTPHTNTHMCGSSHLHHHNHCCLDTFAPWELLQDGATVTQCVCVIAPAKGWIISLISFFSLSSADPIAKPYITLNVCVVFAVAFYCWGTGLWDRMPRARI